jgi:hypothetical protein
MIFASMTASLQAIGCSSYDVFIHWQSKIVDSYEKILLNTIGPVRYEFEIFLRETCLTTKSQVRIACLWPDNYTRNQSNTNQKCQSKSDVQKN